MMSPSPTPRHMIASGELRDQLNTQLASHLRVIQDVDIDLQLAPTDQPGLSRRPDLIVVDRVAVDRVDAEGGLLRACEGAPGGRDRLDQPVTLLACHLAGEFGYQDSGSAVGVPTGPTGPTWTVGALGSSATGAALTRISSQ